LPARHRFDVSTTIELIAGSGKGFRRIVKIFLVGAERAGLGGQDSGGRAAVCVECREDGDEALHHAGAEGEEVEFAFAAHVDEAGGFEFLDVVRERGGSKRRGSARALRIAVRRAAERRSGLADALGFSCTAADMAGLRMLDAMVTRLALCNRTGTRRCTKICVTRGIGKKLAGSG
jgi:hypothetical protein